MKRVFSLLCLFVFLSGFFCACQNMPAIEKPLLEKTQPEETPPAPVPLPVTPVPVPETPETLPEDSKKRSIPTLPDDIITLRDFYPDFPTTTDLPDSFFRYLNENFGGEDGVLTVAEAGRVTVLSFDRSLIVPGDLKWLRFFPNLVELTARNQHLWDLPKEMNVLTSLKNLDLSNNHFSYLQDPEPYYPKPEDPYVDWSKLKSLEYLDFSNNWLTESEPLAGCAKTLKYVDLSNNKIRDISVFAKALSGGSYFDVRGNYVGIEQLKDLNDLFGRFAEVKVGMQFFWDPERGLTAPENIPDYKIWFFHDCKDILINGSAAVVNQTYNVPKNSTAISVSYQLGNKNNSLSKNDFLRYDENVTQCDTCIRGHINWQYR